MKYLAALAFVPALAWAGSYDVLCYDRAVTDSVITFENVVSYQIVDNTLKVSATDGTPIYYHVPENMLCVVKENNKNEQGKESRVRSEFYSAPSGEGRGRGSLLGLQPRAD